MRTGVGGRVQRWHASGLLAFSCAVVGFAVTVTPGHAQTNDQFFRSWRWTSDPGPARVVGLSGAFVAVADDSSATVFNPAGLVQLQKTDVLGAFVARRDGTAASGVGDTLQASTGLAFAGAAAALSPKWRLGGYVVRPHDRRSELSGVPLPDGTGTAGFLRTQVTEVGGAIAWQPAARVAVGARITATHLRLEAQELRTGAAGTEVGAAGGETRVTGSFGGLLFVGPRLRLGISGQPGAAYRIERTANRAGRAVDAGSESELRQPGLVAIGAAFEPIPRVLLSVQLDYVRYSEIRGELVVRSGLSEISDYDLADAVEPRAAVEVSLPSRLFSIQLRGGIHRQAPAFLRYRGGAPVETLTFKGGTSHLVVGLGASLVTRRGFRTDVGGLLGAEQPALVVSAGIRF